jgi:hypothetical protein
VGKKRKSRRVYEHGDARGAAKAADFRELTSADVDRNLRKYLNRHQRTLSRNAAYYANDRVRRGLEALPQYILSDYRFRDYGFPVSWMAPNPSGYAVVKKGAIRRWIFTVFHSFGGSYDWGILRAYPGATSAPTDVNGHNPRRFIGAMRYLTANVSPDHRPARACVHFGISRRGDWVSSVDLNDIAYASGGNLPLGFNKNAYSIGFEFEEHLARHIYGTKKKTRRVYRQPYSKKQILCLAVGLKKINAWRSVIGDRNGMVPWLPDRSSIISAYKARNGGMLQHLTIHPGKRTDPGAQFLAPKGKKIRFGSSAWNASDGDPSRNLTNGPGLLLESGWDTLERYFLKVRGVRRETQVFRAPLTSVDLELAKASEIVNVTQSRAQNIAARAGRDRLAGLSRSAQMQGQSRRSLYNKAAATNVAFSGTVARANTVISSVLRKVDLTAVQGVTGAVMFDEVEGVWEDGEV